MHPLIFLLVVSLVHSQNYICPLGYFFDLQHCETCLPFCICTSMNTCSSCVVGYTSYNNQCIQCPQSSGIYGTCSECCSKTTGTQISCTDCSVVANSYTFLYSGRCIVSPGCFQIDKMGFCQQCFSGFYQTNNLCYSCNPSCATCTDSTNCLTCSNGYYWGVSNGGLCTSCPSGCATCDVSQNCYSCLAYYYLFQKHCLSCPVNCNSCTDGSTCTTCSVGILVSNLCILCTDLTYGGSVGCTTCLDSNNFIKCTQCQQTYFLDASGVCQSCSAFIPGAYMCQNANTPTQCQNDYSITLSSRYYLVGITCIQNVKNCRKISDIYGNCSQCYSNYQLGNGSCTLCAFTGCVAANSSVLNNVCTCTLCSTGYYLSGVVCTVCSTAFCSTCPTNVCSTCIAGYYLNGGVCSVSALSNCLTATATICTVCQPGYYKGTNNLCFNCQSTCATCTGRFVCTSCITNYYLHGPQQSCLPMPSNCLTLDTNYNCNLCSYGYFLSNYYCLPCKI